MFTYYAGQTRIPEGTAPDLKNKSYKIAADVEIPAGGANGVIATQGGRFNGWGLYLLDGKPVFHYNLAGVQRFTFAGKEKLAPGQHVVLVDFKLTAAVSAKAARSRSAWTTRSVVAIGWFTVATEATGSTTRANLLLQLLA